MSPQNQIKSVNAYWVLPALWPHTSLINWRRIGSYRKLLSRESSTSTATESTKGWCEFRPPALMGVADAGDHRRGHFCCCLNFRNCMGGLPRRRRFDPEVVDFVLVSQERHGHCGGGGCGWRSQSISVRHRSTLLPATSCWSRARPLLGLSHGHSLIHLYCRRAEEKPIHPRLDAADGKTNRQAENAANAHLEIKASCTAVVGRAKAEEQPDRNEHRISERSCISGMHAAGRPTWSIVSVPRRPLRRDAPPRFLAVRRLAVPVVTAVA